MNNIEILKKALQETAPNTLLKSLGIEITDYSKDGIKGKMPVDSRTHQFYGMLHGGASVAFAETLCSMAGFLHIDANTQHVVGQEINASHLRSLKSGWVYGSATPVRIGKKAQVWNIDITDEAGELICVSRCTLAVITAR